MKETALLAIAIAAVVLLAGCFGSGSKPASAIPTNSNALQKVGIPIAYATITQFSDSFNAFAPSMSNDGSKIAVRTDKNTIGIYDLESGNLVEINKVPVRGYNRQFELNSYEPKITGEGKAVVFLMQNQPPAYKHSTAEVFAASSDGLVSQRITQAPEMFKSLLNSTGMDEANLLTLSIDSLGTRFAFLVNLEKNERDAGRIIAMLDGKNVSPVTAANAFNELGKPVITGNGKYLVFSADNALYASKMDGSQPQKVVDLKGNAMHVSSSKSTAVVVVEGASVTESGVYIIDIEAETSKRIIDEANGKIFETAASGNGKRVYFTANFTGQKELFVIESDGSNLRQVTQNYGPVEGIDTEESGSLVAFISKKSGAKAYYAKVS